MKKIIAVVVALILVSLHIMHNSRTTLGNVSIYEMGTALITDSKHNINIGRNSYQNAEVQYAPDKKTALAEDLFDTDVMAKTNLHIDTEKQGPKVLIFHTHGSELYADSKNINQGVIGAGEYLKSLIEEKYGIECLHITDRFDVVDGKLQRDGAYERAEPIITQIINENPSIQLVIDLHRDGVNENLRLVTNIGGKNYAKIMFFNGICRKWENGKLVPIAGLENPYVKTNLALSYQMQKAVLTVSSELPRKIYINAYRYSLHMKDKSMLIELGAQTNTFEEACNSIEVIANALGDVCF